MLLCSWQSYIKETTTTTFTACVQENLIGLFVIALLTVYCKAAAFQLVYYNFCRIIVGS